MRQYFLPLQKEIRHRSSADRGGRGMKQETWHGSQGTVIGNGVIVFDVSYGTDKLEGVGNKEGRQVNSFIFGNRCLLVLFLLLLYFFGQVAFTITVHHRLVLIYTQVFGNVGTV